MNKEIWKKMKEKFHERTVKHIYNVQFVFKELLKDNAIRLDSLGININTLQEEINHHDASKYSDDEFSGYVLMTEKYGKNFGYEFTVLDDMEMEEAWKHHYQNNTHHPEFYENIEDMGMDEIVHMVCDWGAMSLEMKNSLIKFKDDIAYKKYKFTTEQQNVINYFCLYLEDIVYDSKN